MWPSIILIIMLFIVFTTVLIALLQEVIIVAVNALIIYLIGLRAIVEIKKGEHQNYLIGCMVSIIFLFAFRNVLPLWPITTFVFQAFVIAQLIKLFKKTSKKKKKR